MSSRLKLLRGGNLLSVSQVARGIVSHTSRRHRRSTSSPWFASSCRSTPGPLSSPAMSNVKASTIVASTVGVAVTGFLAYAAYFDYKRRSDPEFRKNLKREARREARIARSQAEQANASQKNAIKQAVEQAKDDGFPESVEEKEAYFMEQVAEGEKIASFGGDEVSAALCFYKALKVYPQPSDLVSIYDKTVPKPVLDVLAEMIAADPEVNVSGLGGSQSAGSSQHGVDD